MASDTQMLCARLDVELAQIVDQACVNEGIGRSELIRNVLTQWAYGTMPSADDGYRQALRVVPQLVNLLLARVVSQLPATYEEAQALLAAHRGVAG